jgi:hypothetical protein
MAVAFIQEFPIQNRSTENYGHVKEQLGDGPFDGLILHSAGFDDESGVFRIVDVWETREQAERFQSERIQPMIEAGPQNFPNPDNFTPPSREAYYELHDVIKG